MGAPLAPSILHTGKETHAMMEERQRARPYYRLNFGKLLGRLALPAAALLLAVFAFFLLRRNYGTSFAPNSPPPAGTPGEVDFLLLVNWENPVPFDRPDDLVSLTDALGKTATLQTPDGSINETAGRAAKSMFEAAKDDGVTGFYVTTAYRSVAYQETLFGKRLAQDPDYGSDPYDDPVKVLPGTCSEHTTGLAIDILAVDYRESDEGYADTPQGSWLCAHAHEHGFILRYPKDKEHITGVIYEPWHYRYVGEEAAKTMHESGECLEEYLGEDK